MKKKDKIDEVDEALPEYDFSQGVRGKYVERYVQAVKSSGVPMLTPRKANHKVYRSSVARTSINRGNKMAGRKGEVTSRRVASKAGRLLSSPKTSKTVRSVAGSALTQKPDRKKKNK